jgi:hypothetical protein
MLRGYVLPLASHNHTLPYNHTLSDNHTLPNNPAAHLCRHRVPKANGDEAKSSEDRL